jgi:hypothetical protein
MKNVAAESALIRNADTLSRETSHFTPRGLIDAARAELRSERPDGAMMQSVDRLIARGFVRPSAQFEGYLKTDHTDRQIDAFTKMLTNPTPTNPRVSALQLLDGGRDRSNPMHQAQGGSRPSLLSRELKSMRDMSKHPAGGLEVDPATML